jgi:putative endonuclease
MPFHLYIIQSQKDDSFYIGTASDLTERINRHNQGRSKFTKNKRPWKLVYYEPHPDRSNAMKREYALKRRKSKDYINKLIDAFSSGLDRSA